MIIIHRARLSLIKRCGIHPSCVRSSSSLSKNNVARGNLDFEASAARGSAPSRDGRAEHQPLASHKADGWKSAPGVTSRHPAQSSMELGWNMDVVEPSPISGLWSESFRPAR
jgi:hypothetical protein